MGCCGLSPGEPGPLRNMSLVTSSTHLSGAHSLLCIGLKSDQRLGTAYMKLMKLCRIMSAHCEWNMGALSETFRPRHQTAIGPCHNRSPENERPFVQSSLQYGADTSNTARFKDHSRSSS